MRVNQYGVNKPRSIKSTSHVEWHMSGTDYLISAHLSAHQRYQNEAQNVSAQTQIGVEG